MSWHLYYDYEPELRAHVCGFHRFLAQSLECADQDENGDCAHTQHRLCDCTEVYPCAVCPDELPERRMNAWVIA